MTTRRAVTYGGLFCLLAAWLASAASTFQIGQSAPPDTGSVAGTTATESLAAEVQAHAAKLRQRLSTAPVPQLPHRNPFLFEPRALPPRIAVRQVEAPPAADPPPSDPMLSLIGLAEDDGPQGAVRTAILSDDTETVLMVKVGDAVLGRYKVAAIGADSVELTNLATGGVRRLGLK